MEVKKIAEALHIFDRVLSIQEKIGSSLYLSRKPRNGERPRFMHEIDPGYKDSYDSK